MSTVGGAQLLEWKHKIRQVSIQTRYSERRTLEEKLRVKEPGPDQADIIKQQLSEEDDKLCGEHSDRRTQPHTGTR